MIVVTGSVTAREDTFDEILRLSREPRELVRSLQTLAASPTTLELFDASKIEKL
jgi:hypothetical protein